MDDREQRSNRFVTDELHPTVYIIIVGLGLWFVLSAWAGFAADEYTGYLLVVVSGLFLVALAIPSAIWLASRAGRDRRAPPSRRKFNDWLSGDFKTSSEELKASSATIQILLPIAAVAFGMTAFAILTRAIELGVI